MRPLTTLSGVVTLLLPLVSPTSAAEAPNENKLDIETTHSVPCTRKTHNGDRIRVNYNGTLAADGKPFDSSVRAGRPFTFKLGAGNVIQGWDMGLLDMCIGDKRVLTIPPDLGYGRWGSGPIPPNAVLRFETELMGIEGVEREDPPSGAEKGIGKPSAAPARPTIARPAGQDGTAAVETAPAKATSVAAAEPHKTDASPMEENDNECHLLGPYALFVQGALGLLAVTSLVIKRWRESPRRPIKIWFFDVSKQVFGSALLHLANILMSMLSSGKFDVATATGATANGEEQEQPNPCSFYLLNIFIDTTIGIPILVLLLRLLHALFLRTAIASPPESIKSGHYSPPGSPPRATWWLKQSLIYFLGLFGMKLCVFFIFELLPWIAWVGDWALRWTEGNQKVQITFVMFVFPLIMNAMQYWIIDGFIMEREGAGSADEDGGRDRGRYQGLGADDDDTPAGDEAWLERHRRSRRAGMDEWSEDGDELEEANPTAVPIRRGSHGESGAGGAGTGKGRVRSEEREYDPGRDGDDR